MRPTLSDKWHVLNRGEVEFFQSGDFETENAARSGKSPPEIVGRVRDLSLADHRISSKTVARN